jgi:hypothetical protein
METIETLDPDTLEWESVGDECTMCGRSYAFAQSDALSIFIFCSAVCEGAHYDAIAQFQCHSESKGLIALAQAKLSVSPAETEMLLDKTRTRFHKRR